MFNSGIYTDAVDLAKQIQRLNSLGWEYKVDICNGIDKEQVVLLTWEEKFEEDEDE